jgi:hypothetical protein
MVCKPYILSVMDELMAAAASATASATSHRGRPIVVGRLAVAAPGREDREQAPHIFAETLRTHDIIGVFMANQ